MSLLYVTTSYIHPSLIFKGKGGAYPSGATNGLLMKLKSEKKHPPIGGHDTQLNDTPPNDTQHNFKMAQYVHPMCVEK
jgi:hypothetical protein